MRWKRVLGAAVVALIILSVSGAALAASHGKQSGSATETVSREADTDDVQEGDQTAPDGPDEPSEAEGTEAETGSEGTEDDGPGGHEDPAGQVDHQFEGEE